MKIIKYKIQGIKSYKYFFIFTLFKRLTTGKITFKTSNLNSNI